MSNILEVRFEKGQTFATATRLWKGDYGQILLIHGPALPAYYEVHFASTKDDAPQIQVGTPGGVLIPNKFLQTNGYIYAWTFLHTGENDGETKYQIKIPVEDKGIPIDQETPEEKTAVQQAVEALNKQIGVATEAASSAEGSAKRAEEAAASVDKGMIVEVVNNYLDDHPITVDETDPTVPEWAKQPTKPTYTATEVGALPDTYTPPDQTAEQVGADPAGTAASAVSQHNMDATSHNDLRIALQGLSDRINAVMDSDDTTLDQMSEVVAYIKSNKSMIDTITTSKVNVSDIINNLTTNISNKPLSAAQGVVLKTLIDTLSNDKLDVAELTNAVNTALAQAKASGEFDGTDGKSAYAYAVDGGYTGTESEFAAKLAQEKFANPNALTFTGAVTGSYDGSEAVTVEIPSGGGGGGENAWTYEKITLEEAVNAWTIPIPSAKRLIIIPFLRANDTDNSLNTGSVSAVFKVNGANAGYPGVYLRNSAKFYNLYDIEKVKAHTKVLCTGAFDNGTAYSIYKGLVVNGWLQTTADATEEITSVQFSLSTGYLFPADCTVEVWYK